MKKAIKISPSILSADFLNLEREIKAIEDAGADFIHIDIMDGHFVPHLTFGSFIIGHLKKITSLPIEAHLMISNAEQTIDNYISAGSDTIIVHAEACTHLDRIVNKIKQSGVKAGVALNPGTHEYFLEYVMNTIDLVLVMTVNPGFGGQEFLYSQLKKITNLREIISRKNPQVLIEVDGGINDKTIDVVVNAGADIAVAGSYIFNGSDYNEKLSILKKA